jgi:hypothetical protein
MPNILQAFESHCNVKAGRPHLLDSFYPISFPSYIVFHAAEISNLNEHYNHWDLALEALKPHLQDQGIAIVQLQHGQEITTFSRFADKHLANIGFQQSSYIIKNSCGYLGTSDVFMHMASAADKKTVALFGDSYPEAEGPCWNKDYRCLSPDFSKIKPFFGRAKESKRINTISPEKVASEFLSLLKEQETGVGLSSVFIGDNYHNKNIEIIPNFFNPNAIKPDQPVNIRADLHFDEQHTASWIQGRRVNLFINANNFGDFSLLSSFKPNINRLNVFIDSSTSLDAIKGIKRTGVQMALFCKDNNQLEATRLKFIDWVVDLFSLKDKKDIDNTDDIDYTTSQFRSSKRVLSNNQAYPTLYHSENKDKDKAKLFDDPLFWGDLDHLYIFNTIDA